LQRTDASETESELDRWSVRYGPYDHCEICVSALSSDPNLLEGLTVSRPCGDIRLWNALLEILRLGNVTLYVPGDAAPLVASVGAGTHTPRDMVEATGEPRVVTSSREIMEAIRAA
jgi:hypothetical protein